MEIKRCLFKTLRKVASDIDTPGLRNLMRAALAAKTREDAFTLLPLGLVALLRIQELAERQMEKAQAIRIEFQPQDVHEAAAFLACHSIQSYKELPLCLYGCSHLDLPDKPSGSDLMSCHPRMALVARSLAACAEDRRAVAEKVVQAFRQVLRACSVDALEMDLAPPGEERLHLGWLHVTEDAKQETAAVCEGCKRITSRNRCRIDKRLSKPAAVCKSPIMKVLTPGRRTIQELCEFLDVPANQCLKSVMYSTDSGVIVGIIRGDLEVDEIKLSGHLGGSSLVLAGPEQLEAVGLVPGYGSAVGLCRDVRIVVDDSIDLDHGYVGGANQVDHHFVDIRPNRDFPPHFEIADIALATSSSLCALCSSPLRLIHGVLLAEAEEELPCEDGGSPFGAFVMDVNGRPVPMIGGMFRLELTWLLQAILDLHHDERGIIWPLAVAPYQVHLLRLGKGPELEDLVSGLHESLHRKGIQVLLDHRNESPGVKLNDADLLGLPIRLVLGRKTLEDRKVEITVRSSREVERVDLDLVLDRVCQKLGIESE